MNIIDGTTCLKEVEALIKEYTKMLGQGFEFSAS